MAKQKHPSTLSRVLNVLDTCGISTNRVLTIGFLWQELLIFLTTDIIDSEENNAFNV